MSERAPCACGRRSPRRSGCELARAPAIRNFTMNSGRSIRPPHGVMRLVLEMDGEVIEAR